jgi:hypothetical protein
MSNPASDVPLSPKTEYEQRRAARQAEAQRFEGWEGRAGMARFLSFLAILGVLYAGWSTGHISGWGLLAAVAAFVAAVAWHRRVVRRLERLRRAAQYYTRALDRLDDRWAGVGPEGARFARPEHLYAKDLDLFGRGSLFQWLCAARTRMGQDTLAAWLLEPAAAEAIRKRQAAVEELRSAVDLREALAVLDSGPAAALNPQSLREWAGQPARFTGWVVPALAVVLSVAAVGALVCRVAFDVGLGWFLLAATLEGLLLLYLLPAMRALTAGLDPVLAELNLLLKVLRIVEVQQFRCPLLTEISAELRAEGILASRRIAQLSRLAEAWDTVRRNQFVVPFAFVLMLMVHVAYAIERWRHKNRRPIAAWLDAVGRLEALSSLAGYAFEHPEYPFPEIVDGRPRFEAHSLGHPLIPARRRVTNDVGVGPTLQLLLVTGSNMSGKSTLLRTVGINTVLALAGAPVCAGGLQLTPLAIATAMRNVDSLQEGVSAFYAEIQRLRVICDRAATPPTLLFLLDEILHGTNSHDRRIGAEAVIESLLGQGALGLVTTHDLALAEIADRRPEQAANVHFEDQLEDAKIRFDYQLRQGVVPKGNGLVLMRLLGFDT